MHQTDQAGNRIVVAGICGSLRRGRYTRMAVNVALRGAQEVGAQTRLIDLKEYQLVFCDGKEDESPYPAEGVSFVLVDRLAEGANTSRAAAVHARALRMWPLTCGRMRTASR